MPELYVHASNVFVAGRALVFARGWSWQVHRMARRWCPVLYFSSPLVSSRLVSSRLVSSRLVSSRLVSSPSFSSSFSPLPLSLSLCLLFIGELDLALTVLVATKVEVLSSKPHGQLLAVGQLLSRAEYVDAIQIWLQFLATRVKLRHWELQIVSRWYFERDKAAIFDLDVDLKRLLMDKKMNDFRVRLVGVSDEEMGRKITSLECLL